MMSAVGMWGLNSARKSVLCSHRTAHDLSLCYHMLPAVLCFLFAAAVWSQGSTV